MVLVRFNKDTKKWDTIQKEDKIEGDLYLDGGLKLKLDFAKRQQKKDNDVVGTISGDEGSGKSSLAGNIMRYMTDDTFDAMTDLIGAEDDNVVMDKLESIPHGGAIMFDEGNSYFLSTETMKKEQRNLHKLFSIFRQKNLFCLIIAPSLFRLNSYFALDRSRFHIRTYLVNGERGYFKYYGDKRKSRLYRIGKPHHDYSIVRPNITGRFTKCYALEKEEYLEYKAKTLKHTFASFRKAKEKVPSEFDIKQRLIKDIIVKSPDTSTSTIADMLKISMRRVQQLRKEMKVNVSPEITAFTD